MWKKFALVLLGIFVGLLLGEGFLRLFEDTLPEGLRYSAGLARFSAQRKGIFAPDDYLWTKCDPGISRLITGHPDFDFHVRTTSLGFEGIGFRNGEVNGPVYAIALGDSFTWGEGVNDDEVWPWLLQARTGLNFVNMGVSGYSAVQYERVLEKYGLALKPKLILWTFFPNDFYDSEHFQWRMETGRLAQRGSSADEDSSNWPETWDAFGRSHSLLYNLVTLPFIERDEVEEYQRVYYRDRNLDLTFSMEPYWQKRLDLADPKIARGWELTHQAILQGQELAAGADARLVVVILPFKEQTYWPIVKNLLDHPERYDVDRPAEMVRALCVEENISCIDLVPAFKEHAMLGEQVYFRYDAHWNARGHTLAAQIIYERLLEDGLLPHQ
jgi:hypothetical protein